MPLEIEKTEREILDLCGFLELMLELEVSDYLIRLLLILYLKMRSY